MKLLKYPPLLKKRTIKFRPISFDSFSFSLQNFVANSLFCFRSSISQIEAKMLGIFSSSIMSPPDELVAAGCRTPSPKISSTALAKRFADSNAAAVSLQIGDHVHLAFTHQNESPLRPRYQRSFDQNAVVRRRFSFYCYLD